MGTVKRAKQTKRANLDKPDQARARAAAIVSEFDLEGALGFLFRRLNGLSNLIFMRESGEPDLTPMQAGILLTVHGEQIIGLRELARRMYVDRSTMQEVVNRLVKRGLIARRVPKNDRRTYELWVTDEGRDLLLRNVHAMAQLDKHLLKGIDLQRAAIVKDVLQQILKNHGC